MLSILLSLVSVLVGAAGAVYVAAPLALHPENPRYFLFRGKPAILIASGEHYGAVLNGEFLFETYLDELKRQGLNLTRTFNGTYREVPGSFKIVDNTLAPRPGSFLSPWAKNAEGKFDLDRYDPAYFERLKRYLTEAGTRGVVVELVLFCPMYEPELWDVNPMNAKNNVNGVENCGKDEPLTLKHPDLLAKQVAMVKKVVGELAAFDNLYYEVCNEPYFGGVTLEWQDKIIEAIVEAERDLPHKHLIAQNIANGKAKVERPNPAVSIFNFHYASPPDAVALNAHLNKPIVFDETGFKGTKDEVYRKQAWEFLMAGGSGFSHLDYSFTTKRPDGTAKVEPPTPGGGGPPFRQQMNVLKTFFDKLDFIKMKPDDSVITGGVPDGAKAWALVQPGKQFAIYINGGTQAKIEVMLPPGDYGFDWVPTHVKPNETGDSQWFIHKGGVRVIESPAYTEDIALRIKEITSPRSEKTKFRR